MPGTGLGFSVERLENRIRSCGSQIGNQYVQGRRQTLNPGRANGGGRISGGANP